MKKTIVLFISTSICLPSLLFAAPTFVTGKQLLEYCQVALDVLDNNFGRVQTESEYMQGAKAGKCLGFLMSINEIHQFSLPPAKSKMAYCLPYNYSELQGAAVIVQYLKNHPEQLNLPAALLVTQASEKYFPCRG